MLSLLVKNEKERRAYGYIIRLTLPIVIQNIFNSAVSSADVIMLNAVGQDAISAVSLASQYSNILLTIFVGLGSGVSMLSSQYWGKKDVLTIERVQNIAFRFTLSASLIFALPSLFFPQVMMGFYTSDSHLIALGSSYLRILGVSHLFWGISETYFYTLRSIEKVKICTAVNIFTFLLNISLNALLIFGFLGLPKMGVAGVALATAISRFIQFILCIIISHKEKYISLNLRKLGEKHPLLMHDFIHLSLPALGNCLIWGVAFSIYTAIMGHISSDLVAANSIVTVVRNFGAVFCYAVAGSAGIYIGKDLGAGKLKEAEEDSRRALILVMITGILGGFIIFLITPLVLQLTDLSSQASLYLKSMLYINCIYIMGGALNGTLINGIFRAGGDSRFGLICDIIDMWVYAVPLGLFAAFVWKLPPLLVYLLLCTDEFVKLPWVWKHYQSKKWLKNITRDFS